MLERYDNPTDEDQEYSIGYFYYTGKDGKKYEYTEASVLSGVIQYTHGVPSGKWTYYDGSGKKVVEAEFKNGKKSAIGTMPNFDGRLNETQEKALATYLRSIGE